MDLGLTEAEVQTSFNGPAFMSWSRSYEASWENGGVFDSNGTFDYALDTGFLEGQFALQKKIVTRQMELGIGSVLPAFSGKVPGQLKRLFPEANITGLGTAGPAWLDGLDPLFTNISTSFMSKAIAAFGRTGFYEADGYFVGGPAPWLTAETATGNVDVAGAWHAAAPTGSACQ